MVQQDITETGQTRPRVQTQLRGLAWIVGAFAICPCHLPLTLGLLAAALGGTGLGVFLQNYPFVAGAIIASVWAAATWQGFRVLRTRNACPIPQKR